MNGRTHTLRGSQNPVVQVLYILVAGLVLIGAVLMGAIILAFALGIGLVVGIFIWIRVWWLRRKMMRAMRAEQQSRGEGRASEREDQGSGRVIEVEYTVVDEDERSK